MSHSNYGTKLLKSGLSALSCAVAGISIVLSAHAGGPGVEAAKGECAKLINYFSKQNCLAAVNKGQYFDWRATKLCGGIVNDFLKVDCFDVIRDKSYSENDVAACKNSNEILVVDCLKSSGSTYRPGNEAPSAPSSSGGKPSGKNARQQVSTLCGQLVDGFFGNYKSQCQKDVRANAFFDAGAVQLCLDLHAASSDQKNVADCISNVAGKEYGSRELKACDAFSAHFKVRERNNCLLMSGTKRTAP